MGDAVTDAASFSWTIEPLDPRRHDRATFHCGAAVLDDWLRTRASQFERRDLARVYVFVQPGQTIVKGYYALANHTIVYEALPDDQAKGLPRMDIPVVLLGQLAVGRSVQGQGLGEFLLVDALRRAECLAANIGIRAVEVDALDGPSRRFYEKYGFVRLLDDPQHLFLPMGVVRRLKLPPL